MTYAQKGDEERFSRQRGISPRKQEPAPTSSITHPKTDVSQSKKLEYFSQIPHIVFDCAMRDIEKLGFLEFLRHFGLKGFFDGSLGALCRTLNMAKSTISRAIQTWLKYGWISKEETATGMRLTLQNEKLWSDNSTRYRGLKAEHLSRSTEEQQSYQKSSAVPTGNTAVPQINTAVSVRNSAVPTASTESPPISITNRDSNTLSNTTAPSGAEGGVSLFEEKEEETQGLTVEAVLALAAQYLPPLPLAINKKQREANSERWNQAAETLSTLEYYRSLSPDEALTQFEKLLRYVTEPDSPSWWVQKFLQKPQNQLRLWHIAEHEAGMRADMLTRGWQTPEEYEAYEQTIRANAERHWQEAVPVEPQLNPVAQSLNEYDAQMLQRRIQSQYSWLTVSVKPHSTWHKRRAVEVADGSGTVYTLGSVAEWEELHAAIEAWNAQQMQEAI